VNNKLRSYQTVDTLGKSQMELVIKVYDGAIANLKQARQLYLDGNLQAGYDTLQKARKFVVHLYTTLDEEKGGDIAVKLGQLYTFIIEQINIVQATKNITGIDDSIIIMNNIREGWVQLAENLKKDKQPAGNNDVNPEQSAKSFSMSV